MRKLIALLLLSLFVFCNMAYAEEIDLTAMSLEELVELHKMVDAEIDARIDCATPVPFPSGLYIVGTSIKAGMYTISCPEDGGYIDVCLFESQEKYSQYLESEEDSLLLVEETAFEEESIFVTLIDGMVLLVEDGIAEIQQSEAFWMP